MTQIIQSSPSAQRGDTNTCSASVGSPADHAVSRTRSSLSAAAAGQPTGLVDGDDFFDLLAEDVVFEYIITVPGYPRRVAGGQAVAELYRPYGAPIVLDRCYDLAVHHDHVTGVVVLEYASQGRVVATGAA